MQAELPVLACTDTSTDIGKIILDNGFGWWCESKNPQAFVEIVTKIIVAHTEEYRDRTFDYLKNHYTSDRAYKIIMKE
jgi:hypothetical protein